MSFSLTASKRDEPKLGWRLLTYDSVHRAVRPPFVAFDDVADAVVFVVVTFAQVGHAEAFHQAARARVLVARERGDRVESQMLEAVAQARRGGFPWLVPCPTPSAPKR